MSQTHFSISVDVPAPPALVWSVMTDVARWPEWTPGVSRLVPLASGPLRVGSRVRIRQPKLPPAWWRVTELKPGAEFTWVNTAPGLKVTARHAVETITAGSRIALSLRYEGLFGQWLASWTLPPHGGGGIEGTLHWNEHRRLGGDRETVSAELRRSMNFARRKIAGWC